ncbi:MAG: glycoside hydrolase family 13 protein [Bacteroidota bacterium]|nr:glycoside hydrolase family 13 protein [Bacteroidota bacterium]
MKKLLLTTSLIALYVGLFASIQINKLEPAFWWAGMKNPELQIMVYGADINNLQVQSLSPNVLVKRVVKAESPNYLFVYLDLSKATAGKFEMLFTSEKGKKKVSYELKPRSVDPVSHKGFSSSDVIYLLMPDRFANGNPANDNLKMQNATVQVDRNDPNARHGGDLAGIEQHLDYLADLGVTTIWPTPVLENDMPGGSYHGYAATDYYKVDPRFGTNEEYLRLINKAHQKSLKVVMDMVFNHCGSGHLWMKDMPFGDWINNGGKYMQCNHAKHSYYDPHASEYDKKMMKEGWFVESMPDLNQRNPHLAKYLIQNSIWWIEYANLDGIRQDTYPYADASMMAEWCRAVFNEYPNFNIVGEAWYENVSGTAYWQANSKLNPGFNSNLKTVMDFPTMINSHDAFYQDNSLGKIFDVVAQDYLYADVNNLLVFLENHDTDRFFHEMPNDLNIYKQAFAFLFTTRGIPEIYYGTEILINGVKQKSDGYVRTDFPGGWMGDTQNAYTADGRTALQNEAFNYMQKLLKWRKGNEVIAKGSLLHFAVRDGIYVYLREYHGKKVLVILNGKKSETNLSLKEYAEAIGSSNEGIDVITGRSVGLKDKLNLSAKESLILELK